MPSGTAISFAPALKGLTAKQHMAADEAALENLKPGCVSLRFYDWAGPAVTYGRSQSYEFAKQAAESKGLGHAEIVRRPTGGGVVFHDGDITFSIVFPWEKLCAPELIYDAIHRSIQRQLEKIGVNLFLNDGAASCPGLPRLCFSEAQPTDLIDPSGRKVLGGALKKGGEKGLYQGSLRPEGLGRSIEELRAAISQSLSGAFHLL